MPLTPTLPTFNVRLAVPKSGRYRMTMSIRTLLSILWPRRRTTASEVVEVMQRCSIDPDSILWEVDKNGRFAFGRKHPDDEANIERTLALMEWVSRERVKFAVIGWETGAQEETPA